MKDGGISARLLKWGGIAAAALAAIFLVVASGILPIRASSGHWPITAWFLSFAMERSVSTHALGIQAPPLDDPALVLKGGGHYEGGCRPCHGGPDARQPKIPGQMTPHPPFLPLHIDQWQPEELFYIVKHGIKFTGMPPWVSQKRDDEVWAVVAFLLRFPDMDETEYRRLVFGEAEPELALMAGHRPGGGPGPPRIVVDSCARCHGLDGLGRGLGAFPRLAGQRQTYLLEALRAYAAGRRESGIMAPIAAGLSEGEMAELARYYGTLPPGPPATADPAAELLARGRQLARHGDPAAKVPSCADCHGPTEDPRSEYFPFLAGQYPDFLELQLELFAKDHRGGSRYAHLMREVAPHLGAEDRRAVAAYFSSLDPGRGRGDRGYTEGSSSADGP